MSTHTAMLSPIPTLAGTSETPSTETRVPCGESLCKTGLFAGLSDEQLAEVVLLCRQVHGCADQILFSEGDGVAEVFAVLQGEVTVEVNLFQDFHLQPKPVMVEVIGRGGVIGCSALVERRMNMTARCTNDTELVSVDVGELRQLLVARPDIGLVVMQNAFKMATDRLVRAQRQLVAQFGLSEMYRANRNY